MAESTMVRVMKNARAMGIQQHATAQVAKDASAKAPSSKSCIGDSWDVISVKMAADAKTIFNTHRS